MTKKLALILGLSPVVIILFLGLGLQLSYASDIAVNSTHEIDATDPSVSAEKFKRLLDAETAADHKLYEILDSIQTPEGLAEFEKCGIATELNPYKVLGCYEKNTDKIK
jgi:hypothetical protein